MIKFCEGEGGDRLSNIYYLYLVELRAVAKVASILKDVDIKEDQITETLLSDVLQDIEDAESASPSFKE